MIVAGRTLKIFRITFVFQKILMPFFLNVTAYLRQGELAPQSVWSDFKAYSYERSLEKQKFILGNFLSSLIYSVRLKVTSDLTFHFMTGFGFRSAVYLQLA